MSWIGFVLAVPVGVGYDWGLLTLVPEGVKRDLEGRGRPFLPP